MYLSVGLKSSQYVATSIIIVSNMMQMRKIGAVDLRQVSDLASSGILRERLSLCFLPFSTGICPGESSLFTAKVKKNSVVLHRFVQPPSSCDQPQCMSDGARESD
jgi:hypothetical protein